MKSRSGPNLVCTLTKVSGLSGKLIVINTGTVKLICRGIGSLCYVTPLFGGVPVDSKTEFPLLGILGIATWTTKSCHARNGRWAVWVVQESLGET
jgi:hypothetical protein